MSDAMHWSPDPPSRPEPLLRIDLSDVAADGEEAARHVIDVAVTYWLATLPNGTLALGTPVSGTAPGSHCDAPRNAVT